MKLSDFDYELPSELIAQNPIENRSESRLLIAKDEIEHKRFSDIVDYLEKDDVLVINETRVMPCVFYGVKETGSKARIVIVKKLDDLTYLCRIKGKPKVGRKIHFDSFSCDIVGQDDDIFTVVFDVPIDNYIKENAKVLLPEYVKNKNISNERYQTVFSKKEGSLAAPTAALHFTQELMDEIEKKGVKIAKVCLHVSYGTFLPIRSDNVLDHKMEEEYFEVSKEAADAINNCKGRLFVVGTTSLKTIESASDETGVVHEKSGFSNLFITPAYDIKTPIYGLITNFHLPKSTLLLLVSSFYGKRILEIYKEAIKKKYRFYSFGDAMLLIR